MKNQSDWRPTKYQIHRDRLRASRAHKEVAVGSRLIVERIAECYQDAIPRHVRGDLLDLGCGQVPLYASYRDLVSSVTCVDWPSSPHNVQHADVLCDLNEPLPLASSQYDTVIFSDVMEHLYAPLGVLGEIQRVLRPGGKLLMNVPFMYWLHEQPYDYYRYSQFALERLTQEVGLQIESIETLGGGPDVFFDVGGKILSSRRPGRPLAAMLVGAWEGVRRLGPFQRWIASSSQLWPLGYFLVAVAKGVEEPKSIS